MHTFYNNYMSISGEHPVEDVGTLERRLNLARFACAGSVVVSATCFYNTLAEGSLADKAINAFAGLIAGATSRGGSALISKLEGQIARANGTWPTIDEEAWANELAPPPPSGNPDTSIPPPTPPTPEI
jgi:hypothetical protein